MSARAQQPQTATVKGRLQAAGEVTYRGYVIEFENLASHEVIGRIEPAYDGEFSAMHVPYGDYVARVVTYHGDLVTQELVTIGQTPAPIELRLPERPAARAGGIVSAK